MKILVFPKDPNPYQDLLYSNLENGYADIQVKYLTGPTNHQTINLVLLPIVLIIYRLRGFKIFHIHWTYFFRIPKFDFDFLKIIMMYYCVITMIFIKFLGYKLVWTNHETISHEALTSNDINRSRKISRKLSQISDAKIVHSQLVITEMEESKLDLKNIFIIPHGNYNNVYPDTMSRRQARAKLHIKSNEILVLFFGIIKPYKGVDDLIETYNKLISKNVRLVIAGKCINPTLNRIIMNLNETIKFDFYNEHVSNDDVAKYFKASDIVCLPFKEITTSGSALLALSFGKPIIAPKIGALTDLPNNIGFLYDPTDKNALLNSLTEAVSSKQLAEMSKAAALYAESLSWDKIAEKTYEVYQTLTNL